MQKLKVIFAIFILLMSLVPCADAFTEDNCQDDQPTEQHDNDSHSDSDTCTPFCACTCCRLSAKYAEIMAPEIFQNILYHRDVWNNNQLSAPSFPIWQPPRV